MFPKEYIIEDGQVFYRKKPLHRQPLFWSTVVGGVLTVFFAFLAVFFFLAFIGSEAYSDFDSYNSNYYDRYGMSEDEPVPTEYAIGEKVTFEDGEAITVQSMEVDKNTTLVGDYYDQALVVKLLVENNADTAYYFDETAFSVADSMGDNDYYLDLKTYDVNIAEKVDPGAKMEVTLVYGVDEEAGYSLQYEGALWQTTNGTRV